MDLEEIKKNVNKSIRFRIIHKINQNDSNLIIDKNTKNNYVFNENLGEEKFQEVVNNLENLMAWTDVTENTIRRYYHYQKVYERPSSDVYYENIKKFKYFNSLQLSMELYDKIPLQVDDFPGIQNYHEVTTLNIKTFNYNSINEMIKVICQHNIDNNTYNVSVEYFLSDKYMASSNNIMFGEDIFYLSKVLDFLQNAFDV